MNLKQVEDYWDKNLCGSDFIDENYLSAKFFDEYRQLRYEKTHHLDVYIDWKCASNKDVLEVGLGVGADGTRWARHARSYTGVDLTNEAVEATNKHFDLLGLRGDFIKGNAEQLKLEDDRFDIVYSHGVLHHTPDIKATFSEVSRVLKKEGEFILMVYSKGSFNWWIRIQLYFRLRLLLKIFTSAMQNFFRPAITLDKNQIKLSLWDEHYINFKKIGWSYLSWKNFPHRCTDGPDCEIANAYYEKEIINMLEQNNLIAYKVKKAHFPIGGKFPKLERFLSRFIGFHLLIWSKNVKA